MNKIGVSRRNFLTAVASVTAVGTSSPQVAKSRPAGDEQRPSPVSAWSRADRAVVVRTLNTLIPPRPAVPGAGDLGIAEFLDRTRRESAHVAGAVDTVLVALSQRNKESELSEEGFEELVRAAEQLYPEEFKTVLQAVYVGYYGHPQVLAALSEQSPRGYRHPPLASNALDGVRSRGPIFRRA